MDMAILERHLTQGTIWAQDGNYLGLGADGKQLLFGEVGRSEDSVERYLREHPEQKDWI